MNPTIAITVPTELYCKTPEDSTHLEQAVLTKINAPDREWFKKHHALQKINIVKGM